MADDRRTRTIRIWFWISFVMFVIMAGMIANGLRNLASWFVLFSIFLNLVAFYAQLKSNATEE